MLTAYLTAVRTTFSPFNRTSGKTARLFLSLLPPRAHATMAINVVVRGRAAAAEPATLAVTFKDGREMEMDLNTMGLEEVQREVNRHSYILKRRDELMG